MTFEKLCKCGAFCFVVVVSTDKSNRELINNAPNVEGAKALGNLSDVIKLVLRRHSRVLELPKSLPIPMSFNHPIALVDESKPLNVPHH